MLPRLLEWSVVFSHWDVSPSLQVGVGLRFPGLGTNQTHHSLVNISVLYHNDFVLYDIFGTWQDTPRQAASFLNPSHIYILWLWLIHEKDYSTFILHLISTSFI